MKENRENHGLKTMGQKPWVQKDEPKTANVDYSRSLMKSLFYFIWFYYYIEFLMEKNRENQWWRIMGPKPWVKNHEPKTMV